MCCSQHIFSYQALVIAPSVPCVGLRRGAAEIAHCSLLILSCVFPALRDSGQPLCGQWALHRHLRLCPGPDGAAGDEVLCKPHWVCSQQGSTQLAPALWGFFWRGRVVQEAVKCAVRADIVLF